MKEKIKSIAICILFIIIILLRTCDDLNPNCKETYIHDTITVETHDTIFPKPEKIHLKPKNLTPTASYTINEGEVPKDTNLSLKRVYSDSIKDTNLVFYYNIETIGILTKFEPSYKLFIPLKIEHTIEKTITLEPMSRVGIFGGLGMGGGKKVFNMSPFITLIDKKENYYTLNYNLTQKQINVGFGFKINKKRK